METERKESEAQVVIYSDGACRGNPGVGAYGAVIVSGGVEEELSGAEAETTNNRMELTAAIRAFESLKGTFKVHVITDSQYVQRGMTEWIDGWIRRGWRTSGNKPVLNQDLWERLLEVTREHVVTWEWVRGHAGHTYNERCDQLANHAIDRFLHR